MSKAETLLCVRTQLPVGKKGVNRRRKGSLQLVQVPGGKSDGLRLTRPEPTSPLFHTHTGHLLCEALCWELGPEGRPSGLTSQSGGGRGRRHARGGVLPCGARSQEREQDQPAEQGRDQHGKSCQD